MKSLTLVLCVIAILGSAASAFFYLQIGNTKEVLKQEVAAGQARSNELQTRLTESTTKADALQKRLADTENAVADTKSQLSQSEGSNAQLNRDLAQTRNQLTAKADVEETLNREIAALKRELAEAKLAASAVSPEQIETYKTTITKLETRIAELEAPANTVVGTGGNTTAGRPAPAGAAVGSSGKVLSIGNKNAFVVLDIGSNAGVKADQQLDVTRNGVTIATAKVSSVQESTAIAQITPGSLQGKLAKGDTATITQ